MTDSEKLAIPACIGKCPVCAMRDGQEACWLQVAMVKATLKNTSDTRTLDDDYRPTAITDIVMTGQIALTYEQLGIDLMDLPLDTVEVAICDYLDAKTAMWDSALVDVTQTTYECPGCGTTATIERGKFFTQADLAADRVVFQRRRLQGNALTPQGVHDAAYAAIARHVTQPDYQERCDTSCAVSLAQEIQDLLFGGEGRSDERD